MMFCMYFVLVASLQDIILLLFFLNLGSEYNMAQSANFIEKQVFYRETKPEKHPVMYSNTSR